MGSEGRTWEGRSMDLRVTVLTDDSGLSEMVRAQVENVGCACNTARDVAEAIAQLGWADAAVVDLAGSGLVDLRTLREQAPEQRILAIALEQEEADQAREAGADAVLVEPFSIPELVDAVRSLEPQVDGAGAVIDLRAADAAAQADDAPWWATR